MEARYEKGTALQKVVLSPIGRSLPDIVAEREKGDRENREISGRQREYLQIVQGANRRAFYDSHEEETFEEHHQFEKGEEQNNVDDDEVI